MPFSMTFFVFSSAAVPGKRLLDVGGGRTCEFASSAGANGVAVVALDISPTELKANDDVAFKVTADAAHGLPFSDCSFDLVTSRTVLEHVIGVERFVRESYRVLKQGGTAIHLLPCKFAPFAVIAQLVPFSIAKSILHTFRPEAKGVVEFPAFYENCWESRMRKLHLAAGFSSVRTEVHYYQANYFDAIYPAYLANLAYEGAVRQLGLRNLAAYVVVKADK